MNVLSHYTKVQFRPLESARNHIFVKRLHRAGSPLKVLRMITFVSHSYDLDRR